MVNVAGGELKDVPGKVELLKILDFGSLSLVALVSGASVTDGDTIAGVDEAVADTKLNIDAGVDAGKTVLAAAGELVAVPLVILELLVELMFCFTPGISLAANENGDTFSALLVLVSYVDKTVCFFCGETASPIEIDGGEVCKLFPTFCLLTTEPPGDPESAFGGDTILGIAAGV